MTTTADAEALVRRVLDAVPARSHALGALLQLFRIEATEDVPTACVSCERRPVLRVNPRFVEEHCRTDAHLFVLVMHELHHVLLGHTRLFPRVTPAHNVAFDAVINALLCVRFPEEAYTSFFTQQYGEAKGPLRLLAPPEGKPVEPPRLAALHAALYEGRATAQEVFHAIVTEVEITPDVLAALLGSHGGREGEWGTEGPADPSVVDAIRRIVEKWPPPEKPIRGRSLADVLKGESVTPAPGVDAAVLAAARKALLGAADRGRKDARRAEGPRPAIVPLPDPHDRRAGVARSLGTTPLLYRSTLVDPRGRGDGATHVYLDVSGSMDPWLEDLYAALGALRRHIAPDVHLFSTRVVTVPLRCDPRRRSPDDRGHRPRVRPRARAGRSSPSRAARDGRLRRAGIERAGPVRGPARARDPRAADAGRVAPGPRAPGRPHRGAALAATRAGSEGGTRDREAPFRRGRVRRASRPPGRHHRRAHRGARRRPRPRRPRRRRGGAPPKRRLRRRARGGGEGERRRRGRRDRGDRAPGLRRRRLRHDARPASSGPTRASSRCGPTSASARCPRTSARSAT